MAVRPITERFPLRPASQLGLPPEWADPAQDFGRVHFVDARGDVLEQYRVFPHLLGAEPGYAIGPSGRTPDAAFRAALRAGVRLADSHDQAHGVLQAGEGHRLLLTGLQIIGPGTRLPVALRIDGRPAFVPGTSNVTANPRTVGGALPLRAIVGRVSWIDLTGGPDGRGPNSRQPRSTIPKG